ncbi:MAG: chloride channel protein [Ferrimicrobium sp.]
MGSPNTKAMVGLALRTASIGTVVGIVVVCYHFALVGVFRLVVLKGVGLHYSPPTLRGATVGATMARPWLLPLVVGVGGLLAGGGAWLMHTDKVRYHGADQAIDAYHYDPKGIGWRDALGGFVNSLATLGFGGSGGPEGPISAMAGWVAAVFSRLLSLDDDEARVLLGVAVGIGIGTIFGAPLAGVLLSGELFYLQGLGTPPLLQGAVAATFSYFIYGSIVGFGPVFPHVAGIDVSGAMMVWAVVLGLFSGSAGAAYAWSLRVTGKVLHVRRFQPLVALAGGVVVGAIGIEIPAILGTGTRWSGVVLSRLTLLSLPLWLVLLLPIARIVGTALTVESGANAGLFGPALLIGAFTGAALWRVGEALNLPGIPWLPVAFVVVGMASCLGSVGRIPIAALVLAVEMTGVPSAIPVALVAVVVASLVTRLLRQRLFQAQLEYQSYGDVRRRSLMRRAAVVEESTDEGNVP